MPLLTPEYMLGIPTFTLRYFEELCSRLKPPYVIVIDNYQDVPEGSPFHEVINTGLSVLPEGITVMLVSRTEPPKAFARLRANNMVGSLGWHDLRLTENESKAVARLHKKKALSQKAIKEFYRQTDGWVAGLVLLLEKAVEAGHEHLEGRAPHEVFDYFANEIFEKSDNETKEFLQKTSLLPFMTPVMAEGVTGAKEPGKILEGLSRNNFFTVRRRGREPSYQYHPLFREFLIERVKGSMPEKQFIVLEAKAGAVLEEAGYAEDAAGLFINAGQWEGLIGLIMKQAMPMVMQGRGHVLEEWLKSIPDEIFQNVPWLLYWMGLCRLPFNPAEAERYFEDAFEKFNAQNDHAGVFLSWSGAVDAIWYKLESFEKMDPWIDMLDGLVERFGGFPSPEIEARVTASMYQALFMRRPEHPGFNGWEERVLRIAERSPDMNLKVQIFFNYSVYHFLTGTTAKALMAIKGGKELSLSGTTTPLAHMNALLAIAMQSVYSTAEADYEALAKECLKAVDDTLECAKKTGIHVFDFQVAGQAIWSAMRLRDFDTAEEYLAGMKTVLGRVRLWDQGFYYTLSALMELEKGNVPLALEIIKPMNRMIREGGALIGDIVGGTTLINIKSEAGDYEGALEHVSNVRRLGEKIKAPYLEYMALIAEAYISHKQGKDQEGLTCLKKAMAIGKEQGYFNSIMWRQKVMAKLCTRALEEGIETEYVKKLIRVRKLMPDEPPVHIEDWPWPVKIYTLGRFSILRNDKTLRFSRKAQRKPIEMLKVLLARGGRDASVELLCDDLWPDSDGDIANVSFKTNLHRLRKLLGNDEAVILKDGRLSLNPRCCWVDVWAMERTMSEADEIHDSGDKGSASDAYVLTKTYWKHTVGISLNRTEILLGPWPQGRG
jgi:tetratricopeptide (TPR) repeat protein